jgi:hypothetical protein
MTTDNDGLHVVAIAKKTELAKWHRSPLTKAREYNNLSMKSESKWLAVLMGKTHLLLDKKKQVRGSFFDGEMMGVFPLFLAFAKNIILKKRHRPTIF